MARTRPLVSEPCQLVTWWRLPLARAVYIWVIIIINKVRGSGERPECAGVQHKVEQGFPPLPPIPAWFAKHHTRNQLRCQDNEIKISLTLYYHKVHKFNYNDITTSSSMFHKTNGWTVCNLINVALNWTTLEIDVARTAHIPAARLAVGLWVKQWGHSTKVQARHFEPWTLVQVKSVPWEVIIISSHLLRCMVRCIESTILYLQVRFC